MISTDSYIIVYKDNVARPAIAARESSVLSSMISQRGLQLSGTSAKYTHVQPQRSSS